MPKETKPVTVTVRSGNTEALENARLYVFSKEGQLLETTALKGGQAQLRTDAEQVEGNSEVLLGPALPREMENRTVTPMMVKKLGGYAPSLRFIKNEITIAGLRDFPKLNFHLCFITGRLTKMFNVDGQNRSLPVCDARVHICEVDRLDWWWWRIPPWIIAELGKKLKDIILYPERIPIPIPEPDPAPFSPFASLAENAGKRLSSPSAAARTTLKVSAQKLSLAPVSRQPLSINTGLQARSLTSSASAVSSLPEQVKNGLLSSSASTVSETIRGHIDLLHPFICWWPQFWPYFYVCDEIATVYTDCNGRFDFEYFNFSNDKDIYVWVEICLPSGQWVTVYRPPLPCGTHWNYTCGTDINVTITDPRVMPCHCTRQPHGEIVWFRSIGESATALHIEQDNASVASVQGASLQNVGCTDIIDSHRISPFGGGLSFKLLFGDGFPSAGVTHYRWRKTNLKDAALNDISSPSTTVIGGAVNKAYFVIVQDSAGHFHFETKVVPLGPIGAGENLGYRIPHWDIYSDPGVPAADKALTIQWTSPDFWSAGLDSHSLANGLWRFDLELLRQGAGGVFEVVEVARQVFQVSDAANAGNSVDAPNAYLHRNLFNPGNAFSLRVKVRIDNAPCHADIQDASIIVGGMPQYSGECGFLHYTDVNQPVHLSFEATHPRNFATFGFGVVKGNNTSAITPSVNAGGYVISSVGNYTLAGGIFSDDVPASQLLGSCPQAAFSENLGVYALATDGTNRLFDYDAADINAFALSNT